MSHLMKEAGFGDIDPRLLDEAFRRACKTPLDGHLDPQAVLAAILAEARRGANTLHDLVGAGARAKAA